ncbi:patatin-like phospholipase family protein, partial [bacterium]|nr:patatin-like phospholipase family protein [bacterium]
MTDHPDRIIERIVILSDDQRRIEEARGQVRDYIAHTGRQLDVWSVNGVDTCISLLDRYIDLVIMNFAGRPKEAAFSVVRAIRAAGFLGKMLLVNEDASIDSCEWGRRHEVDFHLRSVEQLKGYLPRILDVERKRGRTALVLAGGGILGGFNEAGSVKALYDFGIRDFDMYIGISAGSVIGACVANGASPEEIIEHKAMGMPDFYYPNFREMLRKLFTVGPSAIRSAAEYMTLQNRDLLFI